MIHLKHAFVAISLAVTLLMAAPASADDWTTVGSDAQRSSWVRTDGKLSPATVQAPDFRFLWRIQTSNEARSGSALTAPMLLDFLISHRGFRSLAFVGGSSGGVFVMDTDLERMEWERHFSPGPSTSSAVCPGGMTAPLSRTTAFAMPSMLGFGARGRRTPANSDVGEPGEGAVTLATAAPPIRPRNRPAPTGRTRPPAQRALRGVTLVYLLTANGNLHSLYVSNGRNYLPPVPFLPAGANARGLIVVGKTAFVATVNRCGGTPDGVWSVDLSTETVRTWESDGGTLVGAAGMAFAPDGTVYAATSEGSLVALEGRSLNLVRRSEPIGFRTAPVVFDYRGADHLAVLTSAGSLAVYAAADLRRALASAPTGGGGTSNESALAAWRDTNGTHWIVVPGANSITAWKLTGAGAEAALEKGWESAGMAMPLPPIVVNGVVFALDGGATGGSATLHALDGANGTQLWNSGQSIKAAARGHALSSGPSHVYLTAMDNAVYSFGIPIEH